VSETALLDKLRGLIRANGPMSVADYMAHCLGDPQQGYYATRDPFGAAGDFITAPEISQMFGEIVGAWLIDAWQLVGAPNPVRLVELGPGRGTLMADILRVARKAPDFQRAASIHLVETSQVLRRIQAETLRETGAEPRWHSSPDSVPPGPMLMIANEFFDALPIRQFMRLDIWRERVIGLDSRDRLAFGIGPGVLDRGPDAPQGSILEISPLADTLAEITAARIVEQGGAALIIDYGHARSAPGETLQAVRGHAYADPLEEPGLADLTAHVNFGALAGRAESAGAAVHGPMPQGAFLSRLGLFERAGRLSAGADPETREAIRLAAQRLASPEQMGTLFKALALTRPGITPAPFGH
jgi:SAM-dependent MidA family methyltransferase